MSGRNRVRLPPVTGVCRVGCGLPTYGGEHLCINHGLQWDLSPEFERVFEIDFEDRRSHRVEVGLVDFIQRIAAEERNVKVNRKLKCAAPRCRHQVARGRLCVAHDVMWMDSPERAEAPTKGPRVAKSLKAFLARLRKGAELVA